MRGGLTVCGTTSDAGKSQVVTGLCRLLRRNGVSVAPFKAQNMANNSFVTRSGHEIGRAQGVQALAAGAEPEVAMNPVLLKPTGDRTSQVVVLGRPLGHLTAAEYHEHKPHLLATVLDALADLRRRFDVVVIEGAGSPAEINLLDHDIVNLRIAHEADLHAVVVGDIDRGGVFAALHGTVDLLPPRYRRLVGGFVINKFRGDPALLLDGTDQLEARSGVPTLGVVPWLRDIALDAEDSLALDGLRPRPAGEPPAGSDRLDVAVVRFPRLSNFTDLDALAIEPGVGVRYVDTGAALGAPDLVVLPGSKATLADLAWLRAQGLADAVTAAAGDPAGPVVLGICGGYQALGRTITDPHGVESTGGEATDGLALLDVATTFDPVKVTRRRSGTALGQPIEGYEIHHGRVARGPAAEAWVALAPDPLGPVDPTASTDTDTDTDTTADTSPGSEAEGAQAADGRVRGTTVHGLFEEDAFRAAFLVDVARRRGKRFVPAGVSFAAARTHQFDRVADALEAHVDLAAVARLITTRPPPEEPS
ncbi:cobyric acid synthase [Aquihabitans sp. G128]|uniref:cobyric acid synthase n=1 Tax=Aquihabitans sp. G128 TaxID=2849779 RepID=UPI00352D2776